MQLKSAASFLLIGSILLIVYKLIWLFYLLFLGAFFFGMLSENVQALVAILAGVVSLVLAVSFMKGRGRSAKRITTAIFLAIVSGLWTGISLFTTYDYFEWVPILGIYGLATLCSHLVFLLSCVSLMLFGVALAGNNVVRLRRACMWVIVCCGLSVLISFGISVYTFTTNHPDNLLDMVFMVLETVSLLFPVAWVLVAFALRRNPEAALSVVNTEEF